MNYEMKEKMIESIWNFWHENGVSWGEIFTYLQKEFPNGVLFLTLLTTAFMILKKFLRNNITYTKILEAKLQ